MHEVTTVQSRNLNAKRKQCIGTWLRLLAETKIFQAGDELTEEKARAYEFELRDVPLEQLEHAFNRASRECKYFPKPFEIIELCGDVNAHDRAYQKLLEAYGYTSRPQEHLSAVAAAEQKQDIERLLARESKTLCFLGPTKEEREAEIKEHRKRWAHDRAVENGWLYDGTFA
jgi:hypothetical protein